MGEIRGFILSLVAAASASALIEGFVPESGGMKKYLKYLIALMILLILLSPLRELVGTIPAMAEGGMFSYDAVEAMTRANSIVAMHIETSICDKFAIDGGDVEVTFDGEGITVRTRARFGLLESDLVQYVGQNFGIIPEVVFYE